VAAKLWRFGVRIPDQALEEEQARALAQAQPRQWLSDLTSGTTGKPKG
jgi:long-subunit acyl-CoA synthetase (AMP-forming)